MLQRGVTSLSDAELLAIFLRTGIKGKTAVDLAREHLTDIGGLRTLLNAGPNASAPIRGLGLPNMPNYRQYLKWDEVIWRRNCNAAAVWAALLITVSFLCQGSVIAPMSSSPVCFSITDRIIQFDELFRGTIDGASVHPREAVRQTVAHNAAAIIFARVIISHCRTQRRRSPANPTPEPGIDSDRYQGARSLCHW